MGGIMWGGHGDIIWVWGGHCGSGGDMGRLHGWGGHCMDTLCVGGGDIGVGGDMGTLCGRGGGGGGHCGSRGGHCVDVGGEETAWFWGLGKPGDIGWVGGDTL